MQENPDASISITGCTDSKEAEATEDLGKRRATVVRSYLVDTWKIAASRIALDQRAQPTEASNESDADGAAENRRVEIASSDPTILSAVNSNDTMRVFDPPGVRFNLAVQHAAQLKSWTLFVSEGDRIIRTFHGSGVPPQAVDWRIAEQARLIPRGTRKIEYMLVVQDSNGTVIPTETGSIPVSEVTIEDKRSGGGTDKSIDRFSLILFGFDKSEVTTEHQATLSSVKRAITPTSSVTITGYTDRSGAEDYNRRLSEQRARAIATALGTQRASVVGQGEILPLYDNTTPEGRFYSRTVEVIVETPMK
jgi:outer membrane protein OmpA-like peptidoglycan-associated protein